MRCKRDEEKRENHNRKFLHPDEFSARTFQERFKFNIDRISFCLSENTGGTIGSIVAGSSPDALPSFYPPPSRPAPLPHAALFLFSLYQRTYSVPLVFIGTNGTL